MIGRNLLKYNNIMLYGRQDQLEIQLFWMLLNRVYMPLQLCPPIIIVGFDQRNHLPLARDMHYLPYFQGLLLVFGRQAPCSPCNLQFHI